MRITIFIIVIVFVISTGIRSNDAPILGIGESMQLLDVEHSSVSMQQEWVRMDIYPTEYKVAVQFVFINDGPETTVKMGFPENNTGNLSEYDIKQGFTHFKTYIDGKHVSAKLVVIQKETDEEIYRLGYWVKNVKFKANQKHVIRVEYTAPTYFDHGAMVGPWNAAYYFTGSKWASKVRNSYFLAVLHFPPGYALTYYEGLNRVENRLSAQFDNWEPEYSLQISFSRGIPGTVGLELSSDEKPECYNDKDDFNEYFNYKRLPLADWAPVAFIYNNTAFIKYDHISSYIHDSKVEPNDGILETPKEIRIWKGDVELLFKIGSRGMWENGVFIKNGYKPIIMDFRSGISEVYLPIRPIAELLGISIQYDKKCNKFKR